MSELHDRTADVFEQLAAFGQTLEASAAGPISADPDFSPSHVRFTDDGVTVVELEASVRRQPRRKIRLRVLVAGLVAAAVVAAITLVVARDGNHAVPADQPARTGTPTTPPRALFGTRDGELLVPGTYFVDEVDGTPTRRIFVTIGAEWSNFIDEGLAKAGPTPGTYNPDFEGGGFISFSRPDRVYLDACHLSDGFHPGPVTTLDGLVVALSEQRGWVDVTAPTDISVDGYPGKTFQRTAPAVLSGCPNMSPGHMRLPEDGGDGLKSWQNEDNSNFGGGYYEPGQVETLMVLDIDGTVVVIHANLWRGSSAEDRAEFADVLDSIRIDPRRFDTINAEAATPLVLVGGSRTSGADVELFHVTADEPTYWRLATLPEFDGRTWGLPESQLSPIDGSADLQPDGDIIRQQLEILALKGQLVPAAAEPTQAESNTDVRFNADTSTLVTLRELATGDRFTIVSKAPDVTLDELRVATTDNPPDDLVLEYPDDLPGVVSDLATEVTAGAASDYDRTIALRDWLRNEFTYDLTVAASDDTIEMFLQTRRGSCEQFASTFAVMARTLGIPSRVAVGFTPGEPNGDGSYSVFGKNAHAWPQVWFDGIGWVDFEPTPPGAIPGLEDLPNE